MMQYNKETEEKNLLDVVKPNDWYIPKDLIFGGLPSSFADEVLKDRHQIKLITLKGAQCYLGATILNYAIRSDYIDECDFPYDIRFISPITFARNLEVSPKILKIYNSGGKKLIRAVGRSTSFDYVVDISTLHLFDFNIIDHRKIRERGENEIIRGYKFSGKHQDYFEILFNLNKDFIKSIATKIIQEGCPADIKDDLESEGIFGLREALNNYSFEKNINFKTFAHSRIKGAMLDYLRDIDWIPRSIRTSLNKIERFKDKFCLEEGREPTSDEIIENCKLAKPHFSDIMSSINTNFISLDRSPVLNNEPEENLSLHDVIESDFFPPPDLEKSMKSSEEVLERALSLLDPREQEIMVSYYYQNLTFLEISKNLDLDESRISQIHDEIIKKLRKIADLEDLV